MDSKGHQPAEGPVLSKQGMEEYSDNARIIEIDVAPAVAAAPETWQTAMESASGRKGGRGGGGRLGQDVGAS